MARIITVGQEMVVPGERVESVFEAGPTMPASRPIQDTEESATSGKAPEPANSQPGDPAIPELIPGADALNNSVVAAS